MLYVPTKSSDARRIGNEKGLTLAAARMLATSPGSSMLIVSKWRPWFAQRSCTPSRAFSCSTQSADFPLQKLTIAGLPRSAANAWGCPVKSGSVKSGAVTGASSQVSADVGRDSGAAGSDVTDRLLQGVASWNGSTRNCLAPSSTQTLWLIGRSWSSCNSPLGHRIEARTESLAPPNPNNTSLLCWERKPDPACRLRVCLVDSVCTVTTAPIASRLLLTPRSRNAIDGPRSGSTFLRMRNWGPLRFFRNISKRPS